MTSAIYKTCFYKFTKKINKKKSNNCPKFLGPQETCKGRGETVKVDAIFVLGDSDDQTPLKCELW